MYIQQESLLKVLYYLIEQPAADMNLSFSYFQKLFNFWRSYDFENFNFPFLIIHLPSNGYRKLL